MTDIMMIHSMIHLMINIMIHRMIHIMIKIMIHLMTYIMTNIMTNIMINVMTAWKKVHSHSGQLSTKMPFGIRVALSWSKTSEACPGASERSWRCPLCLWAAAKWRSRTPSHPPRRKMWPGDHLGASRNEPDGLRLLGVSWQALHLLCRHCPRWSGNGLWTFGHPKPFFKEGNSCETSWAKSWW